MTGTITHLERDRGTGSLVGSDGKTYSFRHGALRDVWFHELTEGTPVTFEPGKDFSASQVRPIRASA